MNKLVRTGIAAFALGAMTISGIAATPALAQRHDHDRHDNRRHDNGRHEGWRNHDRHSDRHDNRYRPRASRSDRVVVIHRYDWDRPDPRYRGYYANRYYRGGYAPIRVTRQMRVYRGSDNRYYCRRSDGTTGLIIGAAIGGIIGDRLDQGRSSVLGALLGAAAGGAIGHDIDRGNLVCR